MRTPPHVVVYRAVTVTITMLILLGLGLGLAGRGPLSDLNALTSHTTGAVQAQYATGTVW